MFAKQFVERIGIAPHPLAFVGVNPVIPGGNLRLFQQGCQPRDDLGEIGIAFLQLTERCRRLGQLQPERVICHIALIIQTLHGGNATLFKDKIRLKRNPAAQLADIADFSQWQGLERLKHGFGLRTGTLLLADFRHFPLQLRLHLRAQPLLDLHLNGFAICLRGLATALDQSPDISVHLRGNVREHDSDQPAGQNQKTGSEPWKPPIPP